MSFACFHTTAVKSNSLVTSGCPLGTIWLTVDFCEMLFWVSLVQWTCLGVIKIGHSTCGAIYVYESCGTQDSLRLWHLQCPHVNMGTITE